MRKQFIALLAAILVTGMIALSVFAIGANAMANKNGTAASNSAGSASTSTTGSGSTTSDQAQIAQLQAQVAQYQARELQYQAREQQYQTTINNDTAQISQAAGEIQSIQQLLAYLENRGLIQINSHGQIFVTDH